MASKKSKVLAIAFCAAVMSGIYANTALAASIASGEYNVQDGTGIVQMPIEDEDGNKVGDVQINNIASQNDLKKGDKAVLDEVWAEADERRDADDKLATEISQEHLTNVEQQEQLDDHSQQLDAVRGEISEEHRVNGEQNDRLDAHDISIKNHEAVMGVTDKTGLESAYEGATYIDKNDTMVEADRKLDAAISDVNSRVDGIENRVDGLEDRIDKVGAM